MTVKVRVSNLNKKRKVGKKSIKNAALHILRSFRKRSALIDITFVGDRKIKRLNAKYMNRVGATDVISFLLEEKTLPKKAVIIGDIYISSDTAYANAKAFDTTFQKEILLYTVHGLLHLLGFKDKTASERKGIRRMEEKFLKKFKVRG